MNILVVQTAFLGDVILTLPLVQTLKSRASGAGIDMLVIPETISVLGNHPALRRAIAYDKHGRDSGLGGVMNIVKQLRRGAYDVAVIPHRSLRSAALARLAGIPRRIGFDRSAGSWLFTDVVRYDPSLHEVERNAALSAPLGIESHGRDFPALYPSDEDRRRVEEFLAPLAPSARRTMVALAPGSVWNTKRWPQERFTALAQKLAASGTAVVVLGGEADRLLAAEIAAGAGAANVLACAGTFTILQSAALIGMSRILVTNDTAPMHMAVAMRTPVVALFGATVPSFGFAPYGNTDVILETNGLSCRPCSIHGGATCPIKTFDCMMNISVDAVLRAIARF